jgi:hypothetical protein
VKQDPIVDDKRRRRRERRWLSGCSPVGQRGERLVVERRKVVVLLP